MKKDQKSVNFYLIVFVILHSSFFILPLSGFSQSHFSYGFELASEGDTSVFVAWIDSASDAFSKGVRIGNEVIAWNQLPILQAKSKVSLDGYPDIASDSFRDLLQLYQMTKTDGTQLAQIYYTNKAGNHRGVAIQPVQSTESHPPYPLPITGNSTFFWDEVTKREGSWVGLLIDLRKNRESSYLLEDMIKTRYANLPIMLIQGPLTQMEDIDQIMEWSGEDQVKTIGHWPTDGFGQRIGQLPDFLIPATRMIIMDYYGGWDPLVEEAKIHLSRIAADQREKR